MPCLKQMTLFMTVCFASYLAVILLVRDTLLNNQQKSADSMVSLLEYQFAPLPSANRLENSKEAEVQAVLQEETILNQDAFQDLKHTGEADIGISNVMSEFKLTDNSVFSDSNRKTSQNPPRERSVQFIRVGDMYVYGAYLDLRQKNNATVQLLVLKTNRQNDGLVCYIKDGENSYMLFAQSYKMCESHEKTYEGWIYSCVLPTDHGILPHEVSLAPRGQRQRSFSQSVTTLKLKIIATHTHSTAERIGVCVPPLFGDLHLSSIIHFIQMCKVLGADHVLMYIGSVSSEIKKFLKYYSAKEASLSVIEWNLPENLSEAEDKIWYHGQVLSVQDCLFNNMNSFHFLLFLDLDEMLVPRRTYSWPEMLTEIFTKVNRESVAALSFKSVFFDPGRVPEESENIVYFQHVHRTRSGSRVRNKLMVQPLKVFELGIHHLSKALRKEFQSVEVSGKIALIHHYHTCVKIYEPQMKCYPTVKDKTILRYKENLTHLSHRVITDASKLFA